mmetsp:Transcript_64968/g.193675  ORF Transcript_64968/g.193675 Transcript_64968/m.193675 type:complete len:284 (-) Transcript_64968:82-933(-)
MMARALGKYTVMVLTCAGWFQHRVCWIPGAGGRTADCRASPGTRRPLQCTQRPAFRRSSSNTKLRAAVVGPRPGRRHTSTIVYLHGYTRSGEEYLPKGPLAFCMPWVPGGDCAPGLRAVLPTAEMVLQPWGDFETSWYSYSHPQRNHVGNPATLDSTRQRLRRLLQDEIECLDGDSSQVFLGGSSQGCTVALDVYLQEASRLQLGGFVGSTGFVPLESMGFHGARSALQRLLADKPQAERPLWLQCATDDHRLVPWEQLVKPSLRHAGCLAFWCVRLLDVGMQ